MSSILRALRRLEDEARNRDDGASLQEHVALPSSPRRRGSHVVLVLAAFLLGVFGFGALLFSTLQGTPSEAPAPVSAPAAGPVASPVVPEVRPRVATPAPRPAAARGAEGAQTNAAKVAPLRSEIAAPARRGPVAAIEAPPSPRATQRAAGQRHSQEDVETGVEPTQSAAPGVALPPSERVGQARALAGGAPVGVQRILWHPSAKKRRAWLLVDGVDGTQEVREGEQVGRFAVAKIDASSVLFRAGNTELRHKLGTGSR